MRKRFWKPAAGVQSPDLRALMETAAAGLAAEDELLSRAIVRGRNARRPEMKHAYAPVGAGLSYWLYETTIVYLIWRAWLRAGWPAALDWSHAQLEGTPADGRKRGMSYDLAVFGQEDSFVFEAKSWSYYQREDIAAALKQDADKLRRLAPRSFKFAMAPSKYLLLFGWDEHDGVHDHFFCQHAHVERAGRASFPAASLRKPDDNFIITLFRVLQ